ncbi:MAG: tetrahydromethanopterin S-methyltransferase subunit D [Candidatus Nezhaarchaeota archaeon]|nr:tetrahydromethanopterin S-methyltransferase subunit D [Candidatus Nezhaarchaeota archaeon]MCX8141482.1 tetrahydromethanopterin S-methyltransferase subunit D [Candidatus Nezhaarchaeota archaeon]MDW8049748.1 tetrahydromethanopterin S-methyltransferase subunit D [Nitrososphaerota archaeon]
MIGLDVMITMLIMIALGGVLICTGVFFMPVGGAPAAMSTATGIATGCEMMAAGAGITGLLMAAALYGQPSYIVILNAGISSAIMMCITMFVANLIVVLGKGVPPALATVDKDPVTKENVKPFVTPGTVGHGVPTASFISGLIGAFLGGVGGVMTFIPILRTMLHESITPQQAISISVLFGEFTLNVGYQHIPLFVLSSVCALSMYFINANIAAYSIRGVIEGWWDPKFKRLPKTALACFVASLLFGMLVLLLLSSEAFAYALRMMGGG